jgi:F-type H+-transporting ATPase subunit epsilon
MKLIISTPTAIAAERDEIVSLTAEDASGSFGILPGHADFLTALEPSVVSWREAQGREGHCAVRRGVLTVEGGRSVSIATREAVVSDDLARLERDVIARFHASLEEERAARIEANLLRMKAIRRIIHYLRAPGAARLGEMG